MPNKNCGYAKYASESSAMKAIEVLHSAEICGVKLKVMEAEEPRDAKRKRYDDWIVLNWDSLECYIYSPNEQEFVVSDFRLNANGILNVVFSQDCVRKNS